MLYEEKVYRKLIKASGLARFEVIEKETDLLILANKDLYKQALASVRKIRKEIKEYSESHPRFAKAFTPQRAALNAPPIVKEMAKAGREAKVGPMAAVAGAIAEHVAKDLFRHSKEVIVENGGDIYLKIARPRKIGVFAGKSPFTEKLSIELSPEDTPLSICTSAGTLGHSFSFGKADAVVVTAKSGAIADATATAIGNRVKTADDIEKGLNFAKKIKGIKGVLIIKDDQLGAYGSIKLAPM